MSLPTPVVEGIRSLNNILSLHPPLMAIVVIVNTEPERQSAESEQVWPSGDMVGSYLPLLLLIFPPTYPFSYLLILLLTPPPTYSFSYLPLLLFIPHPT